MDDFDLGDIFSSFFGGRKSHSRREAGIPGNDLGAFMNGPRITVHGNAQDGCGNTMNEGELVIMGGLGILSAYRPEEVKSSSAIASAIVLAST